jgi:hypothetical protein
MSREGTAAAASLAAGNSTTSSLGMGEGMVSRLLSWTGGTSLGNEKREMGDRLRVYSMLFLESVCIFWICHDRYHPDHQVGYTLDTGTYMSYLQCFNHMYNTLRYMLCEMNPGAKYLRHSLTLVVSITR